MKANHLPACSLALGIALAAALIASGAEPAGPSAGAIKNEVRSAANSAGWRDTIYTRVPSGGSCVEASEARARTIANHLQQMSDQGRLGDYTATVGTFSGYDGGSGSLHTYTVVEVKDGRGRPVTTFTIDNYLGPTTISNVDAIDWGQGTMDGEAPPQSQIATVNAARNTTRQGTRTSTGSRPPGMHAHTPGAPAPPPIHTHHHH